MTPPTQDRLAEIEKLLSDPYGSAEIHYKYGQQPIGIEHHVEWLIEEVKRLRSLGNAAQRVLDDFDLAAGRELDAEVAKMMGWHDLQMDTGHGGSSLLVGVPPTSEVTRVPVPDYSTNIGAAWQVLAGWSVTLAHAEGLPWHCHLMRCTREGVWVNGEGHADTAPLAICAAALKAVSG